MMTKASAAEMPFLDHLEELRVRLMWSVGALLLGVIAGFSLVVQFDLVKVLQRPIAPYLAGNNLIITHPAAAFKIVVLVSFVLGLVMALPVILYQFWAFVSPALYQHEKRVVVPVLLGAALLFLAGVCLSWFVILPLTLQFLLTFQMQSFDAMIRADEYFGFAMTVSLALGVVFELPIAILALTALGIVTPSLLHRYRRHAIVLCVVVAAFITPGGDPVTLAAMSVPLYFLFEFSVLVSEVVYRRKRRRAARAAAQEAAEQSAADDAAEGPRSLLDEGYAAGGRERAREETPA